MIKINLKSIFIWLLSMAATTGLNAQSYHIRLKIDNLKDTVIYLAQYYGDNIYLKDTARLEKNEFEFKGDSFLPQGLYVIAGQENNKINDLLLGSDQVFKISFDAEKPSVMQVQGSKENEVFADYIAFLSEKQKEMQQLKLQSKNAEDDAKQKLSDEIKALNKAVKEYQKTFSQNHDGSFAAAFVKASLPIEVADVPEGAPKDFQYWYYRNHYWDHMPLQDDRLLRTPFFHNHLMQYLDKVVPQIPDTINKVLDSLLIPLDTSSEIYKYILWKSTIKYEQSKVMGFDAVFTHLALKYFKTGKAPGINQQVVKNIVERGEILNSLLIGKQAPNLIMMDTADKPLALYAIEAPYTVVVFWDSECGHCRKAVPALKTFYAQYKDTYGLEVYAVSSDTSQRKWKDFIDKHQLNWYNVFGYKSFTEDFHDLYDIYSTPVFYLLDDQKRIVGKRFGVAQLKEILDFEEKRKAAR